MKLFMLIDVGILVFISMINTAYMRAWKQGNSLFFSILVLWAVEIQYLAELSMKKVL